jgi:hypothetical protein
MSYRDNKVKWGKSALNGLMFSSEKGLRNTIALIRQSGITPQIDCIEPERLFKFHDVIVELEIDLTTRTQLLFVNVKKLNVFTELGD